MTKKADNTCLSKFSALYSKELYHYFYNPSAYVVMVVFLLICGYFFAAPLFVNNQASIITFMGIAPLLFTFFVPAIAMRLFSEEKKSGTIEILLTNPVNIMDIIFAKLASAMTVIFAVLILTFVYPLSIFLLGNIDMAAVLLGYAGLFLTCLVFCSISMFASSLTNNQITAFILGFMFCFTLYFIGKAGSLLPLWLVPFTDFIGIDIHLDNLSRAIVDTRDIFYYLTLSAFGVFLTYFKITVSRNK